jgi:hypothetical protein
MSSAWQSSDAAGKRRLVTKLMSLRGINMTTVHRIFEVLEPGDTVVGTKAVRRSLGLANSVRYSTVRLPYKSGGDFAWPVVLPQDWLQCCLRVPAFLDIFVEAVRRTPCSLTSPWNLVLYLDEVTPGNPLRPDNKRKITAFYASFLELGDFLSSEAAWLTIGTLRTSIAKDIVGGMSNVVRQLLRAMFVGPTSLAVGGAVLQSGLFFARFRRLLSDEAAGKSVFCVKGASGLKPCMDCKNVVALKGDDDSLTSFNPDGYLVDISCADARRFDPMEPDGLWHSHDVLARVKSIGGLTMRQFEDLTKAHGIAFEPEGLLADLDLRPIAPPSSYARDPMHTMLCGGVISVEIYLLLKTIAEVVPGFSYLTLKTFFDASWLFPRSRHHGRLSDIFNESRESASRSAGMFKGGASEVLAVYPLIRYFLEVVIIPQGLLPNEVASFLACCRVLDFMDHVKKNGGAGAVAELKREVSSCLSLHVVAYGSDYIKPKHHYMMHMTRQVEEDSIWLDCFVHERKHQVIKEAASHLKNTVTYEKSVLVPVVNTTLHLMEDITRTSLTSRTECCDELSASLGQPCRIALQMRFEFVHLAAKDVLFIAGSACIVVVCVAFGDQFGLLVHPFELLDRPSATTSRWKQGGELQLAVLSRGLVRHAAAWFRRADGTVVAVGR